MKILLFLGLVLGSGGLYFAGGQINKLFRRAGCAITSLALFVALQGWELNLQAVLAYLLYIPLNYMALSTYFSEVSGSPDDVDGIEWFLTGLAYGLAALPLIMVGVHGWTIFARAIFLAVAITWLRTHTGKVFKEEFGSGALYAASIPLLLI